MTHPGSWAPPAKLHSMEIDIVQLLHNLSRSLDFSAPGLTNHHQRVALMSLRMGQAVGLTGDALLDLFEASIIHDIGAVTWREKAALREFDFQQCRNHCCHGHAHVGGCQVVAPVADIILSHHDRWEGNNPSRLKEEGIPLASRIICLADRADVLLKDDIHVLHQRADILARIGRLAGGVFDPYLVALFDDLARKDSFWLDLVSPWISESLISLVPSPRIKLKVEDLSALAELFARVVDAKSSFTYRHSTGVAATASLLGRQVGMQPAESSLLGIAGLLHDLGKVAVPEEVLEKPGPLTGEELDLVRQHTYYTHWLLRPLSTSFPLADWAGYHHERLDGQGYPFGKSEDELDLGARLIAVADVFTALREERPYRPSLNWTEIEGVVRQKVSSGALDRELTLTLIGSRSSLDSLWAEFSAGV